MALPPKDLWSGLGRTGIYSDLLVGCLPYDGSIVVCYGLVLEGWGLDWGGLDV